MPATYEPIATTTLTSTASSINFTSISQSYTDLRVVVSSFSSVGNGPQIRFNSDSNTLYSYVYLAGDYNGVSATQLVNMSLIATYWKTGYPTTYPGCLTLDISNYTDTSYFKNLLLSTFFNKNGTGETNRAVGLWRSTSAITEINIRLGSGSFAVGSTATIYGILRA